MSLLFSKNAFAGARILVTGASSGIGRATSIMLANLGANVILAGRNSDKLEETSLLMPHAHSHKKTLINLVNADETAQWLSEIVGDVGPLSGIFHAAGIEMIRPIRMTKQQQIDEVFGSSLYAAFGVARASSQKNTLQDGASLVFMSSVASLNGQFGMTTYCAAKAGIDGMVRSLSCELANRNIRVNSIAAGGVATEMHERLILAGGANAEDEYKKNHLLGFGSPSNIAEAAIFLLSDASSWITGTTLVVDGGYRVR